jgi:hypothetical protein
MREAPNDKQYQASAEQRPPRCLFDCRSWTKDTGTWQKLSFAWRFPSTRQTQIAVFISPEDRGSIGECDTQLQQAFVFDPLTAHAGHDLFSKTCRTR